MSFIDRKFKVCEFFDHKIEPHIHICSNQRNLTGRCGYGKSSNRHDWLSCPLCGTLVYKVIHNSKIIKACLNCADMSTCTLHVNKFDYDGTMCTLWNLKQ